ncbi:hypothetical protein NX059_008864 [Plenodomus lindquistii]|nr:hypothetical protein NX059_008864 [Plenodomus lindquistii]
MGKELQLHAKCITELDDWKLHVTGDQADVEHGHCSPEFVTYISPDPTPVHEIHLPEEEHLKSPAKAKDNGHIPLISPTSPISAPHSPELNGAENPSEPKLFIKLRGLRSMATADSENGSVDSQAERYITPPTSASTGSVDTITMDNAPTMLGGYSKDTVVDRKKRSSLRVTKLSQKRKAELYQGSSQKRIRS